MTTRTRPQYGASTTRAFAAGLRTMPGEWGTLPTGSTDFRATACSINNGSRSAIFPPADYEARATDRGVQVRYIGPPPAPTEMTFEDVNPERADQLLMAAQWMADDAASRAAEAKKRGAPHAASLLDLLSQQHTLYAKMLGELQPTDDASVAYLNREQS